MLRDLGSIAEEPMVCTTSRWSKGGFELPVPQHRLCASRPFSRPTVDCIQAPAVNTYVGDAAFGQQLLLGAGNSCDRVRCTRTFMVEYRSVACANSSSLVASTPQLGIPDADHRAPMDRPSRVVLM